MPPQYIDLVIFGTTSVIYSIEIKLFSVSLGIKYSEAVLRSSFKMKTFCLLRNFNSNYVLANTGKRKREERGTKWFCHGRA